MLIGDKTLQLKRNEFLRACKARGRAVKYYEPLDDYQPTLWNEWHEGHERFKEGVETKVLWHEHLNEWTLKRIGMIQALGTGNPVVECPYSLGVKQGGVFMVQSGLNKDEWIPYRVALMRTIGENVISITAELAMIIQGEEIQRPATEEKKEFYTIINDDIEED